MPKHRLLKAKTRKNTHAQQEKPTALVEETTMLPCCEVHCFGQHNFCVPWEGRLLQILPRSAGATVQLQAPGTRHQQSLKKKKTTRKQPNLAQFPPLHPPPPPNPPDRSLTLGLRKGCAQSIAIGYVWQPGLAPAEVNCGIPLLQFAT